MSKMLIYLFLFSLLVYSFFTFIRSPSEKIIIEVPKGDSATVVADVLHRNRIIRSRFLFLKLLKLTGNAKKIKSGYYEFETNTPVLKVIKKLVKGESYKIRITIPEGYNSVQAAMLLVHKGIADKKKFLSIVQREKLEGFLFPETYFFEPGTSEEEIISAMKREFERRITPEMLSRAKELKLSLHQLITLASMIEKEATKDDRPLVSAVFHNRLKKNMYLESCASVLYALGKHKEKLTYKDLKVKSPYNTYTNYGLPPGPISNPGIDSINAALYPQDTDALFFVVDKTSGTHIFSRYYKHHLDAQKTKPRGR